MAKKKNQSLMQKFNNFSGAGKLLVFLIAFALIGGGYMVYSSFAATDGEPNNCSVEGSKAIVWRVKDEQQESYNYHKTILPGTRDACVTHFKSMWNNNPLLVANYGTLSEGQLYSGPTSDTTSDAYKVKMLQTRIGLVRAQVFASAADLIDDGDSETSPTTNPLDQHLMRMYPKRPSIDPAKDGLIGPKTWAAIHALATHKNDLDQYGCNLETTLLTGVRCYDKEMTAGEGSVIGTPENGSFTVTGFRPVSTGTPKYVLGIKWIPFPKPGKNEGTALNPYMVAEGTTLGMKCTGITQKITKISINIDPRTKAVDQKSSTVTYVESLRQVPLGNCEKASTNN